MADMWKTLGRYVEKFGSPDVGTMSLTPRGQELVRARLQEALDRGSQLTDAEVEQLNKELSPPEGAVS